MNEPSQKKACSSPADPVVVSAMQNAENRFEYSPSYDGGLSYASVEG
jgi:hypothetical protein